MFTRSIATLLLCSVGFQLIAQKQSKDSSLPIFTVSKKPVTVEEFVYLYNKSSQNKQEEFTDQKVQEYLDLFINFKLKVTEAVSRGLDTTQAFKKEYNSYKDELRKPYLPDGKLIDSLVRMTYSRMKEEVRASHILINIKPEATPADTLEAYQKIIGIRNRILRGEKFEEVAAKESEDPSARSNKGDLGYFSALQMVFAFEQAAYATPVGEISMPVRTRFGYHILKVNDRRPSSGEIEVAHIMIRTSSENADNEKAKNTIFDVYDQLQKGVSWDELCKQYSEDPASRDNGGRLKPFSVGGMPGVPQFEQVGFSLKNVNDISDPFQTQYGWHIIKLLSRKPMASFEDMSSSLKGKVSRDDRVQISKQALQSRLRKENGFLENLNTKTKVFALADTSLTRASWNVSIPFSSENLFYLKNQSYTAGDFVSYVKKNQKKTSASPAQYIEQLYSNYIESIQGQILEEKIMKENPEYKWLLKEYYEGILLFEIMEKEVWNKATADSVGQHKYFEQHKAEYKAGERIKASLYSSNNKNLMIQLKTIIESKDSVKLKDFVANNKIRNESGLFEKSDRPVLQKISWSKGVQSIENNGSTYLILIHDIIPPGLKSFNEARAAVISDYQNHLEKLWLEGLRKKYPVKINKKGKQAAWNQLVKK